MMKSFFMVILFLGISYSIATAQNFQSNFNTANALYQKNDFNGAIELYLKILDQGKESPELYYNLGNAYFKLKKIPYSIYYFELAKKLAPNDEDIDFNLKIANLKIVDKFNQVPKFFLTEWYENIRGIFSSGAWSTIAVTFSWLTFITLAVFFVLWVPSLKKLSFFAAVAFLCITIFCFVFAHQNYWIEQTKDNGIVFTPSAYVKSSPDEKSTDLFILHEGTKVKIVDQVNDWKKIRLPDGNPGWIDEKSLKLF